MPFRLIPELSSAVTQPNRKCQQDADHKPTCVGPVRNTIACRVRQHSADELHHKPQRQHEPGRDWHDTDKDDENQQDIDLGLWEQQKITSHHSGDGPRCANYRDVRSRCGQNVDRRGAQTGQYIKQ